MILVLAVLSTLISAAFAGMVLKQYAKRRKPFQLFWGLGLLFFAIAAGSEVVAFAGEWSIASAKAFYVFGGMLLVGFLGLGSTYLTFGEKAGRVTATIVVALAVVAVGLVLFSDLDLAAFENAIETGEWGEVGIPTFSRIVTVVLNIVGSSILVGGALYSGIMVWKKRQDKDRLIANSVIALGALLIASAGALGALFGFGQEIHTIAQAPGITIMFVGFLLASRPSKKPQEPIQESTR